MNVVRPMRRVSVSPETSPDATGSDRGTDAVTLYPERDLNPHARDGHKILSGVAGPSAPIQTGFYRVKTGPGVGPDSSESVPNGRRSFPEGSPEVSEAWMPWGRV